MGHSIRSGRRYRRSSAMAPVGWRKWRQPLRTCPLLSARSPWRAGRQEASARSTLPSAVSPISPAVADRVLASVAWLNPDRWAICWRWLRGLSSSVPDHTFTRPSERGKRRPPVPATLHDNRSRATRKRRLAGRTCNFDRGPRRHPWRARDLTCPGRDWAGFRHQNKGAALRYCVHRTTYTRDW